MDLIEKKWNDAKSALKTLEEALAVEYSILVRDASIQRFEYTTEAVWKSLQIYLKEREGIICASPKSCFREARRVGILLDEAEVMLALEMVDDRNLASHTYHEEAADKIFRQLKSYAELMKKILDRTDEKTG